MTSKSEKKHRTRLAVLALWLMTIHWLGIGTVYGQSPALTTVKDTVYASDGTLASGTVVITWQGFVSADTRAVFGGNKTVPLTNGELAVALVPNAGATPSGTSYRVRYYQQGGLYFEETWVVPASSPLTSPGPPTVTPQGTTGSTTYCYWISATNSEGETLLGTAQCISNGNGNLDGTNYNQVTWAAVSGATGYRVYRTASQSEPSGSGDYLVASTATTTINDQSNTLAAATIPVLNTTDTRSLSDVRVTAMPSPSVQFSAAQVTGTAVVQNPSGSQTITAASSGVPLIVKGTSGNSSNVLEIYDNQATPQLQFWVEDEGDTCALRYVALVRDARCFSGVDWGEKVAAAIADLPFTGGTVDARGLEGAQAISSLLTIDKPVKLLIGKSTITMTGGTTELIKVTSPNVEIAGLGWDSILQVGSAVGSSVDIIRVVGTSDIQGLSFHDFRIAPQSGTPGRYGINFDDTSFYISYVSIDRLMVYPELGSYAIHTENPTPLPNGALFTSHIRDSVFYGGLDLSDLGDSIRIENNTFSGSRGVVIDQVTTAGSLLFSGNNFTSAGGLQVVSAEQPHIVDNNFEQTATSTEANNALIDLDGTSGDAIVGAVIARNSVKADPSYVADAIRVNYAKSTVIRDGTTLRGSAYAYHVTANATDTSIWLDREESYGELPATFLSDAGTGTFLGYIHPSTHKYTLHNGLNINNSGVLGFGTTGAADVGISRYAVGTIALGNGSAGDISASVLASQFRSNTGTEAQIGGSGFALGTGVGVLFSSTASQSGSKDTSLSRLSAGVLGVGSGAAGSSAGRIKTAAYLTDSNCADAAGDAACDSATAGAFVIDASDTNTVISTTAVTANSRIFLMEDSSLGAELGVACNTTLGRTYAVTARTAGTAFTVTSSAAPTTNPACLSFWIVN